MYVMGKFWRNCVCIWKYVILFMVQSLGKHDMIRLESVLWLPWCLNDYCLFGTPKLCEYKQRMLYAQCTSSFGSNINLCIWWSWFFSQMRKLPAIVVCCFQRCHVIDRQGLARCRRLEAQSVEAATGDTRHKRQTTGDTRPKRHKIQGTHDTRDTRATSCQS